jgi:hypothetical protein
MYSTFDYSLFPVTYPVSLSLRLKRWIVMHYTLAKSPALQCKKGESRDEFISGLLYYSHLVYQVFCSGINIHYPEYTTDINNNCSLKFRLISNITAH